MPVLTPLTNSIVLKLTTWVLIFYFTITNDQYFLSKREICIKCLILNSTPKLLSQGIFFLGENQMYLFLLKWLNFHN